MNLIEELQETLRMEIRSNSEPPKYLEAVITRSDLELLRSLLTRHFGPAAKEPGTRRTFPKEIQGLVDSIGGLRTEQSFFYRLGDDSHVLYAALWPWASDPDRITLKVGLRSIAEENQ